MISLTSFRTHLLELLRIMAPTGMYVDVVYKGSLYRVHFEDLHQKVPRKIQPRPASHVDEIQTGKCLDCHKLEINGVCMNPKCPKQLKKNMATTR